MDDRTIRRFFEQIDDSDGEEFIFGLRQTLERELEQQPTRPQQRGTGGRRATPAELFASLARQAALQ